MKLQRTKMVPIFLDHPYVISDKTDDISLLTWRIFRYCSISTKTDVGTNPFTKWLVYWERRLYWMHQVRWKLTYVCRLLSDRRSCCKVGHDTHGIIENASKRKVALNLKFW